MGKRNRAQKDKRKLIASALTAAGLPCEGEDDAVSKFNTALNDAGYCVQRLQKPYESGTWKGRTPPRSWL